ncbi:MAG: phage portal protein [Acetobacteraceae bacterium]
MNALQRAVGRVLGIETRRASSPASFGLGPVTAGSIVNARVAENLSTVCACVGAISSTIATLPALVYRQEDGGRREAPTHPVSRLIKSPNARMTWPDWVEFTLAQVLLYGNSISVVVYDGSGRPCELIPVPWQNVQVFLLPSGELAFDIVQFIAPWGGTGAPRRYLGHEIFHLKDRSDDGFLGRSRLSRAAEVLEAAMGLQQYTAAVWRNMATPSGALKHPGALSAEARTNLIRSFEQQNAGAHNARRMFVMEEGMEWQSIALSPEDSEVLESRRFTVEELCRLYQVPPPIIQDYSHSTFTNAAQAATWFAQLTLTPWVRKIETEFARSVFTDGGEFHLEIDLGGMLRGDFAARWAAYATAIDKGILSPNEVREAEGYNPRAGGDVAAVLGAAVPAAGTTPAPAAAGPPAAA